MPLPNGDDRRGTARTEAADCGAASSTPLKNPTARRMVRMISKVSALAAKRSEGLPQGKDEEKAAAAK